MTQFLKSDQLLRELGKVMLLSETPWPDTQIRLGLNEAKYILRTAHSR